MGREGWGGAQALLIVEVLSVEGEAGSIRTAPIAAKSLGVYPSAEGRDSLFGYIPPCRMVCALTFFRTAVPFWGTNYLEFEWIVPKTGLLF